MKNSNTIKGYYLENYQFKIMYIYLYVSESNFGFYELL